MSNFETKIENLIAVSKRAEKDKYDEADACECVVTPFVKALGYESGVDYRRDSSDGLKNNINKKVDYDIKKSGSTIISLEAKGTQEKLNKHWEQLHDYFVKSDAVIGILTNGIEAWFYMDLDNTNKMDVKPFFIFNFKEHTAKEVERLQFFCKEGFSGREIKKQARTWKMESQEVAKLKENTNKIESYIKANIDNPSEAFIISIVKGAQAGPFQRKNLSDFKKIIESVFSELLQGTGQATRTAEKNSSEVAPAKENIRNQGEKNAYHVHQNPTSEVQRIYLKYKEGIMGIANNVTEESTQGYFNYKKDDRIFARLKRYSKSIRINMNLEHPSYLGEYAHGCERYPGDHWGSGACHCYIELKEESDYFHAIQQIKIAYQNT